MPSDDTPQIPELPDAIERLVAAENIEELTQELHASARRLTGAHGIALVLRDGDQCHYVDEDAIGPLWKGQKFPMSACVSGWSMLKRETVCISDVRLDNRVPLDIYDETFVQSLVVTPTGTEAPVGALGAYWDHVYAAPPNVVEVVEDLARAVGFSIRRMRANP
jgi:GAF domain-containing protein